VGFRRSHEGVVCLSSRDAFAAAGWDVQIFLLGEAVSLMRDPVAHAVVPVGWPPLAITLRATIAHGIPIHA
jgi:predicted peroxiredoxin